MDKNSTLEILYQERNRLNQIYNTSGWNLWATIGSLSALTWTFISLIESKPFILNDIIPVFIFCFGFYYLLKILYNLINQDDSDDDLLANRYFPLNKELSYIRFSILIHVLIFIFFLYSNYSLNYLRQAYSILFNIICYGIIGLLIIIFLISFIDIPIPKNSNNKFQSFSALVTIIFMIGILITLFGLVESFIINNIEIIVSLKFGLLFFGFYFLILLLFRLLRPNKILDKLDDLLDYALFNKKTSDEILSELEVLILGLELRTYFENSLINYYNALDQFEKQCDSIINDIEDIEKIKFDLSSNDNASSLNTKLNIVSDNIVLATKDFREVEKYGNTIINKLSSIIFYKSAKSDAKKISSILSERFSTSNSKVQFLTKKATDLTENLRLSISNINNGA